MIHHGSVSLTRTQLQESDPHDRVALLQEYALAVLSTLRPPGSAPLDGASRLAESGVDSLQVVELKFSLDELLGRESDVDIFISNPTIRQLAEKMLQAAGL